MSRTFTGYKDYFLYVRKLGSGKFIVDSKDKAFIEYYVGDLPYNTYPEAADKIDKIRKAHKLERFNKQVAA